jgi:hypothetical protein
MPYRIALDRRFLAAREAFRRSRAAFALWAFWASAAWSRTNFSAAKRTSPRPLFVARRKQILEDVRILPVIVAEGKFVQVERQVISRNFVISADDATL